MQRAQRMLGTEHSVCKLGCSEDPFWGLLGPEEPMLRDFQGRHRLPRGGWEEMGPERGRALMEFQEAVPRA